MTLGAPVATVCIFVCALSLISCSGAPEAYQNEIGLTVLVRQDSPTSVMTASIEGTLAVVNDACFGLDIGSGILVTVFPTGTITVGDDGVDVPTIGTVRLGDSLRARGGFVPRSSSPVEIPKACVTDELIEIMP